MSTIVELKQARDHAWLNHDAHEVIKLENLIDKQLANQACIDRQVVRIESARLELLAALTANDANQYSLAKNLINETDLLALIIEMQVLAATN